eukprot:TRINITY_DN7723_c0_g2_i1.p1 TRINITY_DN7723_c0_g2~~TRINITY_DN7723_c0_g2_i1.p1  ORF type:complete len:101 (-),score=35.31 TRINITY_DN7723_c0_g2_i1:83-385(-)
MASNADSAAHQRRLSAIPEEINVVQFPDEAQREIDSALLWALECFRNYQTQKSRFSNKIAKLIEEQQEQGDSNAGMLDLYNSPKKGPMPAPMLQLNIEDL